MASPAVVCLVDPECTPRQSSGQERCTILQHCGIWHETEDGGGHLLLQAGYTQRSRLGSVTYQGLDSHAEFMGCCSHDLGNTGLLGAEHHKFRSCESSSFQEDSVSCQLLLLQ